MTTAISTLRTIDEIAVLTLNSPPVNALSHPVRAAIDKGIETALADPTVKVVIITCAGRTFFAGADITEFGKPFAGPDLNDIFARIEAASKPVVAAIHGTALGGGFELALACHYRIALPSARIGLPEVNLGLLPGAGGTQRTPRLAGVVAALDLIVGGRPLAAADALALGLIDALADGDDIVSQALSYARQLIQAGAPLRRARDLDTDLTGDAARSAIATFVARNAKVFKDFKAPGLIVKAIAAAVDLPFDQGLVRETELFLELMSSTESAAQRHLFFAERTAAKIPVPRETSPLPVKMVAVIGAGTMGVGITLAFLNAGLHVTMIDVSADALARGRARVESTLIEAGAKGRTTEAEARRRVANFETADHLAAAAPADLVVEAVFEQLNLKQSIFRQLDAIVRPDAILASNTSFLDLNAIASVTSRPQSVVGLHFFAPANIMRLLEVVRGDVTSDAVLATAMQLGRTLNKVAVLSGVCDGFIANRMIARRTEAADRLILNGPMPWDVDAVLTDFGFPMGSFQMFDLVGLDVIGWDRDKSAGRTVREVLCEAGRWGQKTGSGFYDYDESRRSTPSRFAEEVIRDLSARHTTSPRLYSAQQIIETLLDPVVNEGARLLEEGVALKASDIDVALVAGYGWPAWTGGPMFWGDTQGLAGIVSRLEARISAGEPLVLSTLLKTQAQAGGRLAA